MAGRQPSEEPYLVHDIDENLSILSTEVTDHLHFVLTGKDFSNERDEFELGEVVGD